MARRVLTALGIAAGLMLAALVAGAAYTALKAPLATTPNSNLNPDNCSPGPSSTSAATRCGSPTSASRTTSSG